VTHLNGLPWAQKDLKRAAKVAEKEIEVRITSLKTRRNVTSIKALGEFMEIGGKFQDFVRIEGLDKWTSIDNNSEV
jgi:hypothetical protein